MLQLNDREWKAFLIKDIFQTETKNKKTQVPTGANVPKEHLINGTIPRITVTSKNNGIHDFYASNIKDKNYRKFDNIVSVSFLGDAFYHPYQCTLDMKVHCLKFINGQWNKYLAMFYINEIFNNTKHNNFGNQISSTDLPNLKIMLPVSNENKPDNNFMETYIIEREVKKKKQYMAYAEKQLLEMGEFIEEAESTREWKIFNVSDIFEITSGKDVTLENNTGNIPFVNSSGINNGVTCFVKDCPVKDKNCITIARTGTVGSTFYQQNEVGISGNIRALKLKDRELNEEIAQFLITALKKAIIGNYDYGKILGTERINQLKIKLPVDADNNIDYKYMEAYIYIYICENKPIFKLYKRCRLTDKEWMPFALSGKNGIVTIESSKSGIDKNKIQYNNGVSVPYITRSDENNGLNMFISISQDKKYKINTKGVLTVGLDTQTCFYQPYDFFTGQNIQVLYSDDIENKYIGLFISTMLKQQLVRFNWGGNGATLDRLKKCKIMLPTSDDIVPDYNFMCQFSQNVIVNYLTQYINFLQ